MSINYQQILEDSVRRLSDLIRRRRRLDAEIKRLERFSRHLAKQVSHNDPSSVAQPFPSIIEEASPGFTEAVRKVLLTYRIWLTPVLVRDLLPTIGFDTEPYQEPLASIHVILKRLVSNGEVLPRCAPLGGTAYIWALGVSEPDINDSCSSQGSH